MRAVTWQLSIIEPKHIDQKSGARERTSGNVVLRFSFAEGTLTFWSRHKDHSYFIIKILTKTLFTVALRVICNEVLPLFDFHL